MRRRRLPAARDRKVCQSIDDHVTLAAIGLDLGSQVHVNGLDAAVLRHRRRTDEAELLKLGHLLDQTARAMGKTQPPAGHAV